MRTSPETVSGLHQPLPRSFLRPIWLYPIGAGLLVAALFALSHAEPGLLVAWLVLGIGVAGGLGWLLAAHEQALQSASATDALTGLANRRHFQECLERASAQSVRLQLPLALLLFDLDHLKTINDRYGHAAGDGAIRAIVTGLKSTCRAGDLIARWGGDEFAVIASCADENEARALAARVCLAVRKASANGIVLSVSGGIALADCDRPLASRPSALFSAADAALLRAKARGGSHVEVARTEVSKTKMADGSGLTLVRHPPEYERKRWLP